jgi:chromosome segregation ATPase
LEEAIEAVEKEKEDIKRRLKDIENQIRQENGRKQMCIEDMDSHMLRRIEQMQLLEELEHIREEIGKDQPTELTQYTEERNWTENIMFLKNKKVEHETNLMNQQDEVHNLTQEMDKIKKTIDEMQQNINKDEIAVKT